MNKYWRFNNTVSYLIFEWRMPHRNGENWQKARSVVNQPMMNPRVAKQYAGKIDQVAQDFVKK